MIRKSMILAVCLTLSTSLVGLAKTFTPDPTKTYNIDCPSVTGRLSADGPQISQWDYTVTTLKAAKTSETGASVEWKFVAVGDKWHIQKAAGGYESRLWAVKLTEAKGLALASTSKNGTWTQFTITDAGDGKSFITCTDGPDNFKRMKFLDDGKVGLVGASDLDASCQVTITEVKK